MTGPVEVVFGCRHLTILDSLLDEGVHGTRAHILGPITDSAVRSPVGLGFSLSFNLGLGQHGGVEVTEVLNHGDEIAVLGVELPYLLLVLLVPLETDLVAPRQLMLVGLDIAGDLFRGMLVEISDGAF